MNNEELIERLSDYRKNARGLGGVPTCAIPAHVVREIQHALSAPSSEEVAEFCRELSWFRGCDDWELDELLAEVNADRKKAVHLIKRLDREMQGEKIHLEKCHQRSQNKDKTIVELEQRIAELERGDPEYVLAQINHDLRARIAELEKWNADMVEKAASGGTLDGYREMGKKLADAEAQIAELEHVAKTSAKIIPALKAQIAEYERLVETEILGMVNGGMAKWINTELERIRGMK